MGWGNEAFLLAVVLISYAVVHLIPQFKTVCWSAVVSASCAVVNPWAAHSLLHVMGVFTFWHLWSPSSYLIPLGAVIAGHVALRRIHQLPILKGRALALVGLGLGYAWLIGTAGFYLLMLCAASGMSDK